jgi:hypothetical protein
MDFLPAPSGWNKTGQDLVSEMKSGLRKSISVQEAEWARNYDRSLLPKGVRFPRPGDVYQAINDVEIEYLTHWHAPCTGSGSAVLKEGERIVVADAYGPEPLRIYALPEDYKQLELRMVPQDERMRRDYGSFSLTISTRDLSTKFRLVAEGR